MARLRAAALKAVLLLVIPAVTFWACVTLASSVMLGIAGLAAWFAALVVLPSLRLQSMSLLLCSMALAWGALELQLRTKYMAEIVLGRHVVDTLAGQEITVEPPLYAKDEKLGFRLIVNRRSRAVLTKNGQAVYDVIYSTDANGFRALPPGPPGETSVLER